MYLVQDNYSYLISQAKKALLTQAMLTKMNTFWFSFFLIKVCVFVSHSVVPISLLLHAL